MKTNRDALWSLIFLLGLPVVFFGAMQVLALAMPDTPRAPYQTALVMALGLIWFAPSALWQERTIAVPNGPRQSRRHFIGLAALFAVILAVNTPQADDGLAPTLSRWLPFLGVIMVMGLWELVVHVNRQRPLARRVLGRRARRSMGFATLMALTLWLIAQATAAQALWIWLICLGVVAGVLIPGTVPRAGASRLGRWVMGLGEELSFGAAVLVLFWISGTARPEDPDQQIAFLVTSVVGITGALVLFALVLPWFFPRSPAQIAPASKDDISDGYR